MEVSSSIMLKEIGIRWWEGDYFEGKCRIYALYVRTERNFWKDFQFFGTCKKSTKLLYDGFS